MFPVTAEPCKGEYVFIKAGLQTNENWSKDSVDNVNSAIVLIKVKF